MRTDVSKVEFFHERDIRGIPATGHASDSKLGEGEVRITHWTKTQEPPRRYPIPLQLRYTAQTKHGPLYGFGQSRMISSKDIIFDGGKGLEPGMNAEIVVAWPRLLDERIRLQLVLKVAIKGSQNGEAEGRILAYDFRTRGAAEAK